MPAPNELQTERLLLRAMDPEGDAEDILDWYHLESTAQYTTHAPLTTLAEVRSFLTQRFTNDATALNYAVTLPLSTSGTGKSHRVIGVIGCRHWPELGYTFHPAFHGKGYATEAVRAFVAELFHVMPAAKRPAMHYMSVDSAKMTGETGEEGFDYALGFCDSENVASQRVLERVGFSKGDVIPEEYESKLLGMRDSVPMFLARPGTEVPREWLQKKVE
ncbi:acyl-CoA N-acyltransferase [Myriangium duriaei CBS 260.36]|uniref:Acyl-CoA N-acyltransferase n=1 Tax=Myriangium duriaei CBS 260.36 TaxID=1168546 RepID=A0A9P4J9Q0_9PEZI|nr:acyl-CoA N-acyltransferase [Myriangium duriaei CBS 260.36]